MIMSMGHPHRRTLTLADGERLKASHGLYDRKPMAAAPVFDKRGPLLKRGNYTMRNILIAGVSALALSATGAMAQTATIDQDALGGSATTEQTGAGSGANASITQGTVTDPTASENDVASIQQAGPGTLDATILQNTDGVLSGRGGDNVAGIVQGNGGGSATAFIEQAGTANLGGIVQANEGNSATILQGPDGFTNRALIKQDDADFAGLTGPVIFDATLNPDALNPAGAASDSIATIRQGGDFGTSAFGEAAILQSGSAQTATIDQGTFIESEGLIATVTQEGDTNIATVTQDDLDNEATVSQNGSTNDATVTQGGFAFSELLEATVTQDGNNNEAAFFRTILRVRQSFPRSTTETMRLSHSSATSLSARRTVRSSIKMVALSAMCCRMEATTR